ncbi:hypothetical protein Tco_1288276, partial [Tanacetum coccineum]
MRDQINSFIKKTFYETIEHCLLTCPKVLPIYGGSYGVGGTLTSLSPSYRSPSKTLLKLWISAVASLSIVIGEVGFQALGVVKVDYKVDPVRKCTRFDFVAQDIFYGHVHKYSATGNERCEVPFIHDMFYRIEDIYGDGRLVLRTVNGAKKTRVDFYKRKKILNVDVMSAMGEEHITCLKE